MKIMITGCRGQLGQELQRQLTTEEIYFGHIGHTATKMKNADFCATDRNTLDICDRERMQCVLAELRPNVVIHCAAMTNVDGCEDDPEQAYLVNGEAVKVLAQACQAVHAKLVMLSTDYVFSGEKECPYVETDPCEPLNVYGRSKRLGERNALEFCSRTFVVRTAWLYGLHGRNFVKAILKKGRERETLHVVNDQFGNPTNAEDLAYHILKLAATEEYGIYHCTGKGVCSWYEFAREIAVCAGLNCEVLPCTSQEYPQRAKRPAYSALAHTALRETVGDEMRPWREALQDYLKKLEEEK